MAKRRSKTVEQQCRYYEVGNIFEYMVETYLNGNMYRVPWILPRTEQGRTEGLSWTSYLSEVEPIYWREILKHTFDNS